MSSSSSASCSSAFWLLARECSAYDEPDIILGLFLEEKLAENAKTEYISGIQKYGDLHEQQSYRKANLEKDVVYYKLDPKRYYLNIKQRTDDLDPLTSETLNAENLVFVLIGTCEAFGQVAQCPSAFVSSLPELLQCATKHLESQLDQSYQDELLYDSLQVNQLRFQNRSRYLASLPLPLKISELQLRQTWSCAFHASLRNRLGNFIRAIAHTNHQVKKRLKLIQRLPNHEETEQLKQEYNRWLMLKENSSSSDWSDSSTSSSSESDVSDLLSLVDLKSSAVESTVVATAPALTPLTVVSVDSVATTSTTRETTRNKTEKSLSRKVKTVSVEQLQKKLKGTRVCSSQLQELQRKLYPYLKALLNVVKKQCKLDDETKFKRVLVDEETDESYEERQILDSVEPLQIIPSDQTLLKPLLLQARKENAELKDEEVWEKLLLCFI